MGYEALYLISTRDYTIPCLTAVRLSAVRIPTPFTFASVTEYFRLVGSHLLRHPLPLRCIIHQQATKSINMSLLFGL